MENWIINHLAARAHYEMPRALQIEGQLKYMITDVWFSSIWREMQAPGQTMKKLLQRGSSAIPDSKVKSFNTAAIAWELLWKLTKKNAWELILARNTWYQEKVADLLEKMDIAPEDIFYSFAYTALRPMGKLRSGVKKILYQMDPGMEEELLVQEEYRKTGIPNTSWTPAPSVYWQNWKKELELSDTIIVNSEWSKSALMKQDVPENKIAVIPLPYTIPSTSWDFQRQYPDKFTRDRPMRVLFLGTLTVRKGFHRVLEVAKALEHDPVEFYFVGQKEFEFETRENMRCFGHVSREDTIEFYKNSDVFLFPTLSDGFGLTQLEALSWKLPVISSSFCGEVVEDEVSGKILTENTAGEITEMIRFFLLNPERLAEYASNGLSRAGQFNHARFSKELLKEGRA